jgi:hypothetical protein
VDDLERIVGVIANGLGGGPASDARDLDLSARRRLADPGDDRPAGCGGPTSRLDELDQDATSTTSTIELDALTPRGLTPAAGLAGDRARTDAPTLCCVLLRRGCAAGRGSAPSGRPGALVTSTVVLPEQREVGEVDEQARLGDPGTSARVTSVTAGSSRPPDHPAVQDEVAVVGPHERPVRGPSADRHREPEPTSVRSTGPRANGTTSTGQREGVREPGHHLVGVAITTNRSAIARPPSRAAARPRRPWSA